MLMLAGPVAEGPALAGPAAASNNWICVGTEYNHPTGVFVEAQNWLGLLGKVRDLACPPARPPASHAN
jgi:hypothetical protein